MRYELETPTLLNYCNNFGPPIPLIIIIIKKFVKKRVYFLEDFAVVELSQTSII